MSLMPLNGTRTHPLTAHAIKVLTDIADMPLPPDFREGLNAGARDLLGHVPPLLPDGQVLMVGGSRAHMNPRTYLAFLRGVQ